MGGLMRAVASKTEFWQHMRCLLTISMFHRLYQLFPNNRMPMLHPLKLQLFDNDDPSLNAPIDPVQAFRCAPRLRALEINSRGCRQAFTLPWDLIQQILLSTTAHRNTLAS
ncbi:hypothetical protein FIBSPDRAFT_948231 [Athelia psychrophila]|uniref:Uncharacterized protein n=1 Tax=Athelia psychrophila TaxID=1759441 RepID=A0A166R7Z0_9AGAM|nr:hypothetical protein FIBSPDRAFT_948231 [Fibularhizoctonia sp. CBS 109695]